MKNKRHNTKFIQTLSLLKMPVITRTQINNSKNSINKVPVVNLMKDVIPIRECAKGKTYLYKTRKFITDIDTGIANILCKGSKPKRNLNKKIKFVGIDENNNNNNSSSISNDIKFQTCNIIQEKSTEKQTVRNLRNKKPVNYSNMDIPIYICPDSMNSIRELSTLEETPIYETFNNDLHNNPKLSNIIKSQYYMEREDPDYVFEEDYDDDEIEELAQVKLKIISPKVSKEILTKVTKDVSKSLSKEVKETILQNEKNNKENIVMTIVNRLTIGRRKNIVEMILDKIEQMKPKTKNSKKNIPK
jgi:hypothetical protein